MAKIIWPNRRTSSFGDTSYTKYFEEFWKLNGSTLAERYRYAMDDPTKPESEIKNNFRRTVSQIISEGKLKPTKEKSVVRQAFEKVTRMRSTWGGGWETQSDNFKHALKTFGMEDGSKSSPIWKKLQNATRDKRGRFVKVNWDTLTYLGDGVYSVKRMDGGTIVVDFRNSPKEVMIYKFEPDKFDVSEYFKTRE